MRNSLEDWKRVPTTLDVLLGIELPYRPPKNPLAAADWRKRVLIETTFGLSVLEPWEKILIGTCVPEVFVQGFLTNVYWPPWRVLPTVVTWYLILAVVFTGLYRFMPHHVPEMYRRTLYYLFGDEVAAVSVKAVAGWAERNASFVMRRLV